jgi:hypothetical protein
MKFQMPPDSDIFWEKLKPEDYTCCECSRRYDCEFAFDDYNTNGDCLREK